MDGGPTVGLSGESGKKKRNKRRRGDRGDRRMETANHLLGKVDTESRYRK